MDKRTGGTFEFTHGTVEGVPSTVHSVDVVSDRFHYGDGHMAKQVKRQSLGDKIQVISITCQVANETILHFGGLFVFCDDGVFCVR